MFVLAQTAARTPAILAQADQTNGSGWFNGDDAVVLRNGTTVLDVIGQVGVDPGTEWGTGPDQHGRQHAAAQGRDRGGRHQRRRRLRPGRRVGRLRDRQHRRPRHPPRAGADLRRRAATWWGTADRRPGQRHRPQRHRRRHRAHVRSRRVTPGRSPARRSPLPRPTAAPPPRRSRPPPSTPGGRVHASRSPPPTTTACPRPATCSLSVGVYPVPVCGEPATAHPRRPGQRRQPPRSAGRIVTVEGVVDRRLPGRRTVPRLLRPGGGRRRRRRSRHVRGHLRLRHQVPPSRVGDVVRVVGRASEFGGQTQVSSVTAAWSARRAHR